MRHDSISGRGSGRREDALLPDNENPTFKLGGTAPAAIYNARVYPQEQRNAPSNGALWGRDDAGTWPAAADALVGATLPKLEQTNNIGDTSVDLIRATLPQFVQTNNIGDNVTEALSVRVTGA